MGFHLQKRLGEIIQRFTGQKKRESRLIIHAGLHKSGTTSIQFFLRQHYGVDLPRNSATAQGAAPRGEFVFPISDQLSRPHDTGHNRFAEPFWMSPSSSAASRAAETLDEVIGQTAESERLIISAEDLSYASEDDLQELASRFGAWQPRIVFSVSPLLAVFGGLYSTNVQFGYAHSIQNLAGLMRNNPAPALDPSVFHRFSRVFQDFPIEIVMSLRTEQGEAFLKRFCGACGIPWPRKVEQTSVARKNESLSAIELELLIEINVIFWRHHDFNLDRDSEIMDNYVALRKEAITFLGSDAWRQSFPREPLQIDGAARTFLLERSEAFVATIREMEQAGQARVHGDVSQLSSGLDTA